MSDWIALVPAILLAIAILTIPGWSLAWLSGVRGYLAIAGGVPLSVGLVAVAAIFAPVASLDWSIWIVIALWAVVAFFVAGIRFIVRRRRPSADAEPSTTVRARTVVHGLVGVALGGALTVVTLARTVGNPENFSLRFDNVFHLNAVRYALETGNASSFWVGGVTSAGSPPAFYPAAWHDLVSLVAQLSGDPIPQSVNALNIAVAVAAWVGGAVLLGQLLTRNTLAGSIIGAIAACAFPAFPILMLEWGVLYPNFLAFALLPTMVALLVVLFRVKGVAADTSRLLAGLLLVAGLPGLALAHPNGALTLGLFFAVVFVLQVVSGLVTGRSRRPSARRTVVAVAGVVVVLAVTVAVWLRARPSLDVAPWHKVQSTGQAIGEVLTNSVMQRPFSLLVSIAVIVGLIVLLKRREFAFPLMAAATTVMFVVSSAFADGWIRELITGPFYQDNYRLASLTAVGALPLAIVGAITVWDALQRTAHNTGWIHDRSAGSDRARQRVTLVLGSVAALLAIVGTQFAGIQRAALEARPAYERTPTSELVDTHEYELMMDLPDLLPDDAVLVVNPGTGAAFAYALTGFTVTATHMFYESSKDEEILRTRLNDAATNERANAAVCDAVDDLGRDVYILDFSGTSDAPGFAGLKNLRSPVVDVVERSGKARLLHVSICD